MKKSKPITLFAVTGMSPQVVTETLYFLLVERKEKVNDIFILTTAEGKRKIIDVRLDNQIKRLCELYNKPLPDFDIDRNVQVANEESVEIYDVRTNRDNLLFPDAIVKLIREKTGDSTKRLHCSIAGGRKTMSVAMAFALSLFGRKEDELSHVLVSKEFEESKKFFPKNRKEGVLITLADVPFIRLRDKLPLLKEFPNATFTQLVKLTQKEIEEMISIPVLVVRTKQRSIKIQSMEIYLPPFEFAVYIFFLKSKKFIPGGKRLKSKDAELILKYYKEYSINPEQFRRFQELNAHDGLIDFTIIQKAISGIKSKIRKALQNDLIANNYIITTRGGYGLKEYGILLEKTKIKWE